MNKAKHFMEQDFPKEVDMHWGGNEAISIKFESKQEFTTYAVHLEKLERQYEHGEQLQRPNVILPVMTRICVSLQGM
jgi:hypothetical protein